MNQALTPSRQEVMLFLEKEVELTGDTYLTSPETNWQPADLLPASNSEQFFDEVKMIQGQAENLDYDLLGEGDGLPEMNEVLDGVLKELFIDQYKKMYKENTSEYNYTVLRDAYMPNQYPGQNYINSCIDLYKAYYTDPDNKNLLQAAKTVRDNSSWIFL